MNIPKSILNKIQRLKDQREKANKTEQEIFEWFESKGIDTSDNNFIDYVGTKVSYGEFDYPEDINDNLIEFLKRRS